MTMTDEEKAQARATDPLAAADHRPVRLDVARGDAATCMACCGIRTPSIDERRRLIPEVPEGVDWWDPLADNAVGPTSTRYW